MSLKYTPVTQRALCLIFSMYVRTISHVNYCEWASKKQFAVHDFDTSMTLTQGQDYQTWYELVHPKQSYSNVTFDKPHLNSVQEKASDIALSFSN